MSKPDPQWLKVLEAGVKAQVIAPGAVAVGGTAAALYAQHRYSEDSDHIVAGLREHFEDVLARLESSPGWKTARVQRPVLILGSIDDVHVGFRQSRRAAPIEAATIATPAGPLTIPTLDELIGMKAYLAATRNATRDYLDFAALTQCSNDEAVVRTLLKSNERYGALQTASIAMEIARALADPRPYDLDSIRLDQYKGLVPALRSWDTIRTICGKFGSLLGHRVVLDRGAS